MRGKDRSWRWRKLQAIWRFLWWLGTISVHVFVDQNRKDHTVREASDLASLFSDIKISHSLCDILGASEIQARENRIHGEI